MKNIVFVSCRKKKPRLKGLRKRKKLLLSSKSGKVNFPLTLKVLLRMKFKMEVRVCFLILWST